MYDFDRVHFLPTLKPLLEVDFFECLLLVQLVIEVRLKQAVVALIVRLLAMHYRCSLSFVRYYSCFEVGAAGDGLWPLDTACRICLVV